MTPQRLNRRDQLFWLLLPALAILLLISLQKHHFHDRAYRQDEAWVVSFALEDIARLGILNYTTLSIMEWSAENIIQDLWLHFFGHVERVTRWLSTLMLMLALAFYFRLATDIFDRRSALFATLILGSYSVFAFFTGEARPYAALALGAIGFQWALLRFIRRPSGRRGLACLALGLVPMWLHPFMLYVFAAQFICVVVFVRWDRRLYTRGMLLWLALGSLALYRAWWNFSSRSGSIKYNIDSDWDGIAELLDQYRFNPESLAVFLLAFAAYIFLRQLWILRENADSSRDSIMRFGAVWREGWLLLLLLVMLGLPLLVNAFSPSLTPRNLLIIAPALVLILTVGLRKLPLPAQMIATLLFLAPFVTDLRSHISNAAYWEMVDFVDAHHDAEHDRLAVMTAQAWEWIAMQYFLERRADPSIQADDIFTISWQRSDKDDFAPRPLAPERYASGYHEDDWKRLRAFLGERDRLFIVVGRRYPGGDAMLDAIESGYSLADSVSFPGDTYYLPLGILEYRRHPPAVPPLWRYGDDFDLLSWRLLDDHRARPCGSVTVESWWAARQNDSPRSSATLVLADAEGQGIVNSDSPPGGIPTSTWQSGRPHFDSRKLTLPCDIQSGEYPLLLGMYAHVGDAVLNLPVTTAAGEATPRKLAYLTTLAVNR